MIIASPHARNGQPALQPPRGEDDHRYQQQIDERREQIGLEEQEGARRDFLHLREEFDVLDQEDDRAVLDVLHRLVGQRRNGHAQRLRRGDQAEDLEAGEALRTRGFQLGLVETLVRDRQIARVVRRHVEREAEHRDHEGRERHAQARKAVVKQEQEDDQRRPDEQRNIALRDEADGPAGAQRKPEDHDPADQAGRGDRHGQQDRVAQSADDLRPVGEQIVEEGKAVERHLSLVPEEVVDDLVGAALQQVFDAVLGIDLAAIEEDDTVGNMPGEAQVVGDAEDRDIVEVEAIDQRDDLADHDRIERGRRLVEEQDLRIHRQRPRDRDPLALPAGKRRRKGVALVGHLHELELVERAFFRLPLRHLLQPAQRERDIVQHRHVAVEREILEDEADAAAHRADVDAGPGDILAVQQDRSGSGLDEQVQAPQQRRLAASRRPHDDLGLAFVEVEADAVEHDAVAVGFDQVFDFEKGHSHSCAKPAML